MGLSDPDGSRPSAQAFSCAHASLSFMPAHHHHHDHDSCCGTVESAPPGYRRVLWIALAVNAVMFAVEIASGFQARSVSLLADAIDFFGDAANYGITLAV